MMELRNLSKAYAGLQVLDGVSADLAPGGLTAIIGPNGAGKSTLLSIIGRMLKPDTGHVTLDGLDLARAPSAQIARKLGVLRQDNQPAARLTVAELVAFGRYPHSKGRPTPECEAQIARAIDWLGLAPFANRYLDELSGGQRQRAWIAMVLAQDTDHILLDEPLNNLDIRHAVGIMSLIRKAADELGKTILVVLHDINMAATWCDRIMVMKDGRLVASGSPAEIIEGPLLSDIYETPIEVHSLAGRRIAVY